MLRGRGSLSRATSRRRKSSIEYEVVNPGRVWVDVVDNYDIEGAPYHGIRSSRPASEVSERQTRGDPLAAQNPRYRNG